MAKKTPTMGITNDVFVYRVPWRDALYWQVGENLGCELVDEAGRNAPDHIWKTAWYAESIEIDGDDFVVIVVKGEDWDGNS